MDITISPGLLSGSLSAIASKSHAHRLLICAAFSDRRTTLICRETNRDIEATAQCLRAIGAKICRDSGKYIIDPIVCIPEKADLFCGESGSTLRFMLPIVGALGIDSTFHMEGRLPQRPLSPLWEQMQQMGCQLSRPAANTIRCTGKLRCGNYNIDGSISSQFITGLLFAMAVMDGESTLTVTGKLESKPYVDMTQKAMSVFGVKTDSFSVSGSRPFRSPGTLNVEGDWSNTAFFLAANALGSCVSIHGLDPDSAQGDCAAAQLIISLKEHCTISAADIPDLVPILSVVAAANKGAEFSDIRRLRLKESDRVASVCAMLEALGIRTATTENTLTIYPGVFQGGIVDAVNDHRIAMSAAVAATIAEGAVTILGAECVSKSYPTFWDEYRRLGGSYEQYVRK